MRGHRDFLLLLDVPETAKRRQKQVLAVGAIGLVVRLATMNVLPIAALAVMAAVVVVATGCIDVDEAYESVDWKIIFLIFGMLALGMALEKTKGAELVAHTLIRGLGTWGPLVVLSAVVLLTSALTNFLSNNAVAVLLTPIAIQAATAMQVKPAAISHRRGTGRLGLFRHADRLPDQHAGLWRGRLQIPRLHQSGPAVEPAVLCAGEFT